MARIALGGFHHETNTFASMPASYDDFVRHDAWPGLSRGQTLIDNLSGLNIPIGGFLAAAHSADESLVPLSWCSAEPSGRVTRDAFERIAGIMEADLRDAGDVDALYLCLHGAMVCEHLDDGEGELLTRLRGVLGEQVPIVVSLDLHANITRTMVDQASAITIYRTYPHVDMADTGRRAYELLRALLDGERFSAAHRQAPFLVPLQAQCTDLEPAAELYRRITQASGTDAASVDFAFGFPAADIEECGPSLIAYDPDPARAEAAVERLLDALIAAEHAFDTRLLTPRSAIARAMAANGPGPSVLADAQDNSGAGASSDTTAILSALIEARAERAVLGALHDPTIAARANELGVGTEFDDALGGRQGLPDQPSLRARFRVLALSDGRFTCRGPMLAGVTTDLGPCALLGIADAHCDVRVVVTSTRFQCLDRALFTHLGIDPREQRIVVVKSTVHFRADFDAIAREILPVDAPGSHPCRLDTLPYRRLRPGVRLGPGGPSQPIQST